MAGRGTMSAGGPTGGAEMEARQMPKVTLYVPDEDPAVLDAAKADGEASLSSLFRRALHQEAACRALQAHGREMGRVELDVMNGEGMSRTISFYGREIADGDGVTIYLTRGGNLMFYYSGTDGCHYTVSKDLDSLKAKHLGEFYYDVISEAAEALGEAGPVLELDI